MPTFQRWKARRAAVTAALAAGAGAFLVVAPYGCARRDTGDVTVTIPRDVIQERVAREFPLTRGPVRLSDPRVTLRADSDRIGLETRIDAPVELPLLGRVEVRARAAGDGRLRYDPGTASFLLDDPALVDLSVEGLPDAVAGRVASRAQALMGPVLREVYPSVPLHTLDRSLSHRVARRFLRGVRVTNGQVEATFSLTRP